MKKTFFILSMLIMISSVVFAGGTKNPSPSSSTAIVMSGDIVKVFYKSDKTTKVKVTIFNQDSKKVFSESVKNHSGFTRPYNLSKLPEGEYRIVLEDENGKSEKTVRTIHEDAKVLASIINLRKAHNKCNVLLFTNKDTDVTVRLLDDKQHVLKSASYHVKGQSSKLFDLTDFEGQVSVEVSGKNGVIKTTTIK